MPHSSGPPAAWSAILADAVAKPGVISDAYQRFWRYSVGNQLLALFQCHARSLEPGPINTFCGWKQIDRKVKKGEKALTLCMPVTVKHRTDSDRDDPPPDKSEKESFTLFVYRPHWFVLAQTEGTPYVPPLLPQWTEERALAALSIHRTSFTVLDGNTQGYAQGTTVAISPIAFTPHRTLFHELAHVVLGHTTEAKTVGDDRTPHSLREVEAESVALICSESLGLAGAEFSRGYIQHYLRSAEIPERSAQRIFKAADTILRAGRPEEKGEVP
jgi:antirestriction protein ArdC